MPAFGVGVIGLLALLATALAWLRGKRGAMASGQAAMATTWLSLRRLVGLGFALLLVLGAMHNVHLALTLHQVKPVFYAAFGLGLACLAYFFGRYGRVGKYSTTTQDVQAHEARRKKYGWRW